MGHNLLTRVTISLAIIIFGSAAYLEVAHYLTIRPDAQFHAYVDMVRDSVTGGTDTTISANHTDTAKTQETPIATSTAITPTAQSARQESLVRAYSSVQELLASDDTNHAVIDNRQTIYRDLCRHYDVRCERVIFDEDLSGEERFIYIVLSLYMIEVIDQASYDIDMQDSLMGLTINSRYGHGSSCQRNNRWCANKEWYVTINLGGIADENKYHEFVNVLTHELGHVVDLAALQGTSRRIDVEYTEFGRAVFAVDDPSLRFYQRSFGDETTQHPHVSRKDFCSWYARTNTFESFAECFTLYILNNAYFRYIAQDSSILAAKYDYIDALMNGQYLFEWRENISRFEDPSYRVYDTTTAFLPQRGLLSMR